MTKASAIKAEGPVPDVMVLGDALQAQRRAEALEQARARVADAMAAFDALEPEHVRVKPLAADFARWKDKYQRDWVRAEPGIDFLTLDGLLKGGPDFIAQFPRLVAEARALYATMTVEGSAYAERTIRERLRLAESILAVEEYHRRAQDFVEKLDATLARRIAAGTLQPPALQGLAPATSDAASGGSRRALSALSGGDDA